MHRSDPIVDKTTFKISDFNLGNAINNSSDSENKVDISTDGTAEISENVNENSEADIYDNINDDECDPRKSVPINRRMHATDIGNLSESPKTRTSISPQTIAPFVVKKRSLFSANYPINCLKFSPDGNHLACGSTGGVTRYDHLPLCIHFRQSMVSLQS